MTITVSPKQLEVALKMAIDASEPILVWGPSGCGKSECMQRVSVRERGRFIDLRGSLLESIDLRGLPHISGDITKWIAPEFLPTEGKGVLILDEINLAHPSVLSALFQLILDRRVGEYRLPDGWSIMAGANTASDNRMVTAMPAPLRTRFLQYSLETDVDHWVPWASANNIIPEIIAFAKIRGAKILNNYDPKASDYAFGNWRAWAKLSKLYNVGIDASIEMATCAGRVGEALAAEFIGFKKIWDKMPSIDGILANPETADIPDDISAVYAVTTALGARTSLKTIDAIIIYASRLPEEFGVKLVYLDCLSKCPEIKNNASYTKFCIKYGHLMV
jgi:hypothetical protein